MSLALAPDTALESALNLRDAPQLDIGPELISRADEGNGRLAERRTVRNKAWIHPTSKLDETGGFQCLAHSNWTKCSPLSYSCAKIIPTYSLSYWEPILITPEVQL